ncbi:MAG: hypothetical protein LAO77_08355 [Acidobacteriia bacterium]|nr:hypothetical protein [Terriglobia bacterium]
MNDHGIIRKPSAFDAILSETETLGFNMVSEPKVGALLVDDLLPQSNWPEGHAPKVPALISNLERRSDSSP